MQLWAQWWLVITRPSGETKLPEQPPASRTELSCASESHCASGEKPYFCCTFFEGKLSYVHMPSSARAETASVRAQSRANLFIGLFSSGGAVFPLPAPARQGGAMPASSEPKRSSST